VHAARIFNVDVNLRGAAFGGNCVLVSLRQSKFV
jgi:hypothetical protein